MKKKLISISMAFALMLVTIGAFTSFPSAADTAISSGKIVANGKASIKATPDMAYVHIGVEKKNQTVEKAQSEVTVSMNAVLESLKKLGIKESDIKTIQYTIYPNYQWVEKENKQVLNGYTVSHQLEVTIRNINSSGKVLDQVVTAGGNHVSGIRFGLSNQDALYNQALELAVKNAKIKAESMGKGLGIKSLKPILIQEQSTYNAPYMRAEAMADNALKTEIMPGEMEISAEVMVEFAY